MMNRRINFGKNPPLSFRESLPFSRDCPYKIRCKDVINDDIAPPHYAGTMEIDVCCGITGEAVIDNQRIPIRGDTVLVVPPGVIHSVTIRTGPGRVYVLHISFEALRPLVDAEGLLALAGWSLENLPRRCPSFGRIHGLVLEMIQRDEEPFARTRALIEILEVLFDQVQSEQVPLHARQPDSSGTLRRVLRWTEAHFVDGISVEECAHMAGFSKNYFCTWFKANTGLTYNCYLNQVRIHHACQVLAQTGSISAACYNSGFRDMSYFIQRFKKTQGVTPKLYLRNLAGSGGDGEAAE